MPEPDAARASERLRLVVCQDSDSIGGAEFSVGDLLAELRSDIDVTVVGSNDRVVEFLASRRPNTERVIVGRIGSRYALRSMLSFRTSLACLHPHIVQFNLPWAYNGRWEVLMAATVRQASLVVVEQSPFPLPTRRARILKRVSECFIDAHVAISESVAEGTASVVGSYAKVRVIHNGVPDLTPPDRAPHVPLVVGTIARLDAMKGIDVLLRALTTLPDARLVVVGSGEEDKRLRTLAEELGIAGRVEWAGWSEHPRTRLGDFDVFVLPSRVEGMGRVLCEAMLARLPVVASRVGGIPDVVVDGATGLLVAPDDPAALSSAIAGLLADPDRRDRMGDAGRLRAKEHFTATRVARDYEALYDELAATRRTTSTTKPRTTSVE